jgi:hypothetical protein
VIGPGETIQTMRALRVLKFSRRYISKLRRSSI